MKTAKANSKSPPPAVRLLGFHSVYLSEPIEGARQIAIFADLSKSPVKGQLRLDPNICSLNAFGDPEICTKESSRVVDVTLHAVKIADPQKLSRKFYAIRGPGLDTRLFLVLPGTMGTSPRLVSESGNGIRRILTLEELPAYARSISGYDTHQRSTPKTREIGEAERYEAFQAGDRVIIIAAGRTPTPGYQVQLLRLPITVFPPEHTLVFQRPSDPQPQVPTPFSVSTHFISAAPVGAVIIHDAKGKRTVQVIPVKESSPNFTAAGNQ